MFFIGQRGRLRLDLFYFRRYFAFKNLFEGESDYFFVFFVGVFQLTLNSSLSCADTIVVIN